MRLLQFDPGSRNFAYSVMDIQGDKFHYLEIGQFINTIVNLTPYPAYKKPKTKKKIPKSEWPFDPPIQDATPIFVSSMNRLLDEYKPHEIVIERFQARGLKGSTIEAVSIMIGMIYILAKNKNIKVRLITAAQWKNRVNTIVNLDTLYGQTKKLGFSPHETDASCMGIYHYFSNYNGDMSLCNQILKNMERWTKHS